MHACVLISSAYRDTSPVGWRPTWPTFTKHAHLFQDPVSKHSHLLRCCGQDGTCECGGYLEPIAPPYLWDRFFPLGHTERFWTSPLHFWMPQTWAHFWCPLGCSWSDTVIWEPKLKLQHHWGEMRLCLWPMGQWSLTLFPQERFKAILSTLICFSSLSRSASHLEQKSM